MPPLMNKIISIVFATLLAFPMLLKVGVYTSWQINRDFIAKTSCENRFDPSSDCEGKCQLQKQLKKTENQEQPFAPPVGIEKVELANYTSASTTIVQSNAEESTIIHFNKDSRLIKNNLAYSFFHPPEYMV